MVHLDIYFVQRNPDAANNGYYTCALEGALIQEKKVSVTGNKKLRVILLFLALLALPAAGGAMANEKRIALS